MTAEDDLVATARATQRDRLLINAVQGGEVRDAAGQVDAVVDVATVLADAGIPYALIGGIAVAIRSHVARATDDVDVAASSGAGQQQIRALLESHSFTCTGTFAHSINFRHSSGEPVQIAFDPAFDTAISRAESLTIRHTPVRVVLLEDLIEMKLRAADDPARRKSKALRDQADVELLRGDVPDPDEGW